MGLKTPLLRKGFLARKLLVLGKFTLSAMADDEGTDRIFISMFHIQCETSSENKGFLMLSEVLRLHSPYHLLLSICVQ